MPARSALPPWARRTGDALLSFTAATIPLSTTGMQLGVGALGVLSLVSLAAGWGVVRRTPLDVVLGVFFGCCALSTLASGHPFEAFGWAKTWTVIAFFVVYWWLDGSVGATRFMRTLAAFGALAALYGIVQHFTGIDLYREWLGRPLRVQRRIPTDPHFAVVGFFRNYLTFAHTLALPYSAALGLGLRSDGGWWIAAIVILTSIIFSTARGAWIAVVAATVVILALGRSRRAALVTLALLTVAGGIVWQSTAFQREIGSIFALGGDNAGRVAIYRVNLDIIHDHPVFGLGFGRYQAAALPYYRKVEAADRRSHAHSNFLQIAAEAGLLALAAFGLVFATGLRFGFEGIIGRAPPARATAAGAFGGIVGFLIGGLTQYTYGDGEVVLAMWCVMAVLQRCRPNQT